MKTLERIDVRLISAEALRQYMAFRGLSIQKVASLVGVSKSTIGHLHSGARNTCRLETARGIARVLDVPVQALFAPKMSTVYRDARRAA